MTVPTSTKDQDQATTARPAPDAPLCAQPQPKKARVETEVASNADSVAACFAPGLLDSGNADHLAAAYKTSAPYLHTCIDALVVPALLRDVRAEIEQHLVFTEKETDIYKVLQTGDLANIDGLPEDERKALANLHRLRDALYSSTFREFVAKVTGCGALSGSKQDMSINSYCQGSHLLNHDDVIGTRRVSYILYVPDPKDWDPAFGGALELYPCVAKGTPDVAPTLSIPPKWNQFVMFTVQPGYSFHSVQEVVAPHDRLSISGWFHIPQEGEPGYEADASDKDAAPASLAQLEDDSRDVDFPFTPVDNSDSATTTSAGSESALTDADRAYLGKYLNADYLKADNLEQINERFGADSSIQLVNFLNKAYADVLQPALLAADTRDGLAKGESKMKHGTGLLPGWAVQGSPVKQRFMVLTADVQSAEPEEATKLRELRALFRSAPFRRWTAELAGLAVTHQRGRARRFRPGLDYTLGTSSNVTSILDLTLSLTPEDECWEEGEVGGYECYIAGDEQNDDPAIYRAAGGDDDSETLLATQAGWNVLTVVLRDQGVMRFVKYVSALASSSRWDLSFEYLLQSENVAAENVTATE